jgi:hypothetical protein
MLSYSGFNYIRKLIADRLDSDFGTLYRESSTVPDDISVIWNEDYIIKYNEYLNSMERIVIDKNLDRDIVNFLFLPDIGGSIKYKTCRKLAAVLLNESCGFMVDFDKFKEFLIECYSHRRSMRWS